MGIRNKKSTLKVCISPLSRVTHVFLSAQCSGSGARRSLFRKKVTRTLFKMGKGGARALGEKRVKLSDRMHF